MTQRQTILPVDTVDAIAAAAQQELIAVYEEMDWPKRTMPKISPGLVRAVLYAYEKHQQRAAAQEG